VADQLVKDLAYEALAASLGNRFTRDTASNMLGGLDGQPPVQDFLASIGAQRRELTPIEEAARSVQDVPMQSDKIQQVIQNMPHQGQSRIIDQIYNALQNLQLTGEYGTIDDGFAKGSMYGGRIGYGVPMEDGKLSAGVTGSGMNISTPFGRFGQRDITGGDISYQTGPNVFGASYNKYGSLPGDIGVSPIENLFQLTYRRQFD
jgi:hypothetical protein